MTKTDITSPRAPVELNMYIIEISMFNKWDGSLYTGPITGQVCKDAGVFTPCASTASAVPVPDFYLTHTYDIQPPDIEGATGLLAFHFTAQEALLFTVQFWIRDGVIETGF